jgi:hypothetical protein
MDLTFPECSHWQPKKVSIIGDLILKAIRDSNLIREGYFDGRSEAPSLEVMLRYFRLARGHSNGDRVESR